jgi:hypothetical protein
MINRIPALFSASHKHCHHTSSDVITVFLFALFVVSMIILLSKR